MTNPITHLFWGYSISKNVTKDKDLIILGLIASIILDIDALPMPGLEHHGIIHTPVFVIIISLFVYAISKSEKIFIIVSSNLFLHLFLDTIGTRAPVMWFYPFSNAGYALGAAVPFWQLIIVKVFLFLIPLIYIHHCWRRRGENPLDLIEYSKERIGRTTTYILLIMSSIIIGIIIIIKYIIEYTLELTGG